MLTKVSSKDLLALRIRIATDTELAKAIQSNQHPSEIVKKYPDVSEAAIQAIRDEKLDPNTAHLYDPKTGDLVAKIPRELIVNKNGVTQLVPQVEAFYTEKLADRKRIASLSEQLGDLLATQGVGVMKKLRKEIKHVLSHSPALIWAPTEEAGNMTFEVTVSFPTKDKISPSFDVESWFIKALAERIYREVLWCFLVDAQHAEDMSDVKVWIGTPDIMPKGITPNIVLHTGKPFGLTGPILRIEPHFDLDVRIQQSQVNGDTVAAKAKLTTRVRRIAQGIHKFTLTD